jgi:hypothetical protein
LQLAVAADHQEQQAVQEGQEALVDQEVAVDQQIIPQDLQALQDKVLQEDQRDHQLAAVAVAVEDLVLLEPQEAIQQLVMAGLELPIRLLDHL